MSAFVQLNLGAFEAWWAGDLSHEEFLLAVHVAGRADFRSGTYGVTLEQLAFELGWRDPKRTTTARRLSRLVELGFLESDVSGRGRRRYHVLRPTPRLLRIGRAAQQSAANRAAERAAQEPAQERALQATGAANGAANGAATEETIRDNPPPTSPQDREQKGNGKHAYVPNLSAFTGCRAVRGEGGLGYKRDPLGTDRPPQGWPHDRPSRQEVADALAVRAAA